MLVFALVAFLAFCLLCSWYLARPSCSAMTWSVFLLPLCFILATYGYHPWSCRCNSSFLTTMNGKTIFQPQISSKLLDLRGTHCSLTNGYHTPYHHKLIHNACCNNLCCALSTTQAVGSFALEPMCKYFYAVKQQLHQGPVVSQWSRRTNTFIRCNKNCLRDPCVEARK
jgi:hypothetical protein